MYFDKLMEQGERDKYLKEHHSHKQDEGQYDIN